MVTQALDRAKNAVIPAGIAGIQKPWRVTCRRHNGRSRRIASPQFHIPVDWIPAIPAGMTGLHHFYARSQAPILIGIHKSLRVSQNPEGVQAISRGLSVATPPDGKPNKISTPEGSQSFLRSPGYHQSEPGICGIFGKVSRFLGRLLRPLWGRMRYPISTGGVATLNPRLMAGNPTGWNISAFYARSQALALIVIHKWSKLVIPAWTAGIQTTGM